MSVERALTFPYRDADSGNTLLPLLWPSARGGGGAYSIGKMYSISCMAVVV